MPSSHIVVLQGNALGNDKIITDPHGCLGILSHLHQQEIAEHDRLFIAGDLTDRGNESLALIKFIIEKNEARKKRNLEPEIHVIRGNHEEMLLLALKKGKGSEAWEACVSQGGQWINELNMDEADMIVDFIHTLPYIITVKKTFNEKKNHTIEPFHIVHADMPFCDAALQDHIENDKPLTPQEIFYSTWAREYKKDRKSPVYIQLTGRNCQSTRTYCGHNVLEGARPKTNTFNLDTNTVEASAIIIANHTENTFKVHSCDDHEIHFEVKEALDSLVDLSEINKPEYIDQEIRDSFKRKLKGIKNRSHYLSLYKSCYLELLTIRVKTLNETQREHLAFYLIKNLSNNPLAEERDYPASCFFSRKESHSIETRSMHVALSMLLKGNEVLAVKRQGFSKDITISQVNKGNVETHHLTRHAGYF